MTDYRRILTMLIAGCRQREIEAACKASPKVIVKARKALESKGLSFGMLSDMTDDEVKAFVSVRAKRDPVCAAPDLDWADQKLTEGMTVKETWALYKEACEKDGMRAYSYCRFADQLRQKHAQSRATAALRLAPGQLMICTVLPGEPCTVGDSTYSILVFFLPYSQMLFLYPSADIKKDFIQLMVRCLTALGGTPLSLYVSDSFSPVYTTRKGVRQIRPACKDMLSYYGMQIVDFLPDPVIHDELKEAVNSITASLAGKGFADDSEMKAEMANLRDFFVLGHTPTGNSRKGLYEAYERHMLHPLPGAPFEETVQKPAKILYNYHVSFEGVLYSVPPEAYSDSTDVMLIITAARVEIVSIRGEVLAEHRRLNKEAARYSTLPEHVRDEDFLSRLPWNAVRFLRWARKDFSLDVESVVRHILESRPITTQAYRRCMNFLKTGEAEKLAGREQQFLETCAACTEEKDPYREIMKQLRVQKEKRLKEQAESCGKA